MTVPSHHVKLDVSTYDRLIQIRVLHVVRINVPIKHLLCPIINTRNNDDDDVDVDVETHFLFFSNVLEPAAFCLSAKNTHTTRQLLRTSSSRSS